MPIVGAKLPLVIFLNDGDDSKFIRATIKDPTGTLVGAPVSLSSIGDGTYVNGDVDMPDFAFVTAIYQVFDDAGFTTPAPEYDSIVGDVFPRDDETAASIESLTDAVTKLTDMVHSLSTVLPSDIVGTVGKS